MGLLCLHLLQASMVYINTLMIQQVLKEPGWSDRMLEWRAPRAVGGGSGRVHPEPGGAPAEAARPGGVGGPGEGRGSLAATAEVGSGSAAGVEAAPGPGRDDGGQPATDGPARAPPQLARVPTFRQR
jgi:hypothetical protein